MSTQTSDNNKRIAKNTLLLFFRMLFMMVVSLYTSRVVLNALGVEDFGIYNVVGGVVAMFLSGSLPAWASLCRDRYPAHEVGQVPVPVTRVPVTRDPNRKPRNCLIIGGISPKLFHKRRQILLNNQKDLTFVIRSFIIFFVFLQQTFCVSYVEMQKSTSETNLIFV